jgi:hypothetical protein
MNNSRKMYPYPQPYAFPSPMAPQLFAAAAPKGSSNTMKYMLIGGVVLGSAFLAYWFLGREEPSATSAALTSVPTPACPFKEAQIVRCSVDGGTYRIENAQKRPFTMAGYIAAGRPTTIDYDCADISRCPNGPPIDAQVSPCALANGSVVACPGQDAVYLIESGLKRHFSPVGYGAYQNAHPGTSVTGVDCGQLAACPAGPDI